MMKYNLLFLWIDKLRRETKPAPSEYELRAPTTDLMSDCRCDLNVFVVS
jgi:hypothetical protein